MKLTANKIEEIIKGMTDVSEEKVINELTKQGYTLDKREHTLVGVLVYIHTHYVED